MNQQGRPTDNTQVANHLNQQKGAPRNLFTEFENEVRNWFMHNGKKLRALTGSKETADRLLIAALNTVSVNPTLIECTWESFVRCLLKSAEYQLYPGGLSEVAYVPYENKKTRRKECQFIIQYQGTCTLLYRSGMVKDIETEIICEKDYFEMVRGSDRKLTFERAPGSLADRGKWIGAYAIIRNIFGGLHISQMDVADILSIREQSPGGKSNFSPWNSDNLVIRSWMWMKTPLKQAAKLAPRSSDDRSVAAIAAMFGDDETATEEPRGGMDISGFTQPVGNAEGEDSDTPPQQQRSLDAPREGMTIDVTQRQAEPVAREQKTNSPNVQEGQRR